MPDVEFLPTAKDKKDPNYCSYHRWEGQFFKQCYTFQRSFSKEQKVGVIFFQEGDTSINSLPFSKHDDQGKADVMTASHCEEETERIEERLPVAVLIRIVWLKNTNVFV